MSGDCGPFVPTNAANGPSGGGGGIQSIAGGTTLATGPLVSFLNSNNVSFGISGNTITASVVPETGIGLAVPGTTLATGTVVFSNLNGVSFGINGSTITARVATVSGTAGQDVNIIASGAPIIISNVNSNIIVSAVGELYLIGDQAVYLRGDRVEVAQQSNRTLGFYGVAGATRQTVTGTNATAFNNLMNALNSLGLVSNGATMSAFATGNLGAISAAGSSISNGTIVFSNSNGVSFGMNGSTVTASVAGAPTLQHFDLLLPKSYVGPTGTQVTAQRMALPGNLTATAMVFGAAANAISEVVTFSFGAYTMNGSTASRVSSFTQTLNISTQISPRVITFAAMNFTPGDYYVLFRMSANAVSLCFDDPINVGGSGSLSWFDYGVFTNATTGSINASAISVSQAASLLSVPALKLLG